MTKIDELQYLSSLGLHTVKPGLKRILYLLHHLGNPQNNFKSIIVGGTNGKGSVCSMLSSALVHNSYRTGLYTSPHLIKVNERISIDDKHITDTDLRRLINLLKNLSVEYNINLSYFEFITALAFIYFSEQKADIAVLEVGMGGRWDATNVVSPLISIITNITFDHMNYLGDTLEKIGLEKAEIIKNKIPVVTACSDDTIATVMSKAHSLSAPIYRYGTEFTITANTDDKISYEDENCELVDIKTNMRGVFQIENLGIALKTLNILKYIYSFNLSEKLIRKGIENVKWPGRFEIIDNNKPVILDCAHNESSSKALVQSINKLYPDTKFNFLIGMLRDKDHSSFIRNISSVSDTVYLTNNFSDHEISPAKLSELCNNLDVRHEIINNYEKAFKKAIELNTPLCITGSIYLIGAVRELLIKSNNNTSE